MVVKSALALTICTPRAPFKSPVATPKVVGVPSIWPKPPRLVIIAPPMGEQFGPLANPLTVNVTNRVTPNAKVDQLGKCRICPPYVLGSGSHTQVMASHP